MYWFTCFQFFWKLQSYNTTTTNIDFWKIKEKTNLYIIKQIIGGNRNRWLWIYKNKVFIHSRNQSGYSLLESAGLAPWMRCTQRHSMVCDWGLYPSWKTCLIKCTVPLLDSHLRKLQPFKCYCSSFQAQSESTCLSGASLDSRSGCDQIVFSTKSCCDLTRIWLDQCKHCRRKKCTSISA